MDIRQSGVYAEYMRRIGWVVEKIDNTQIFIRRFPLIGWFIKIQRPERVPSLDLINTLARKYRAWMVSVELINEEGLKINELGFKNNKNPYLPTKTIHIDLTASEKEIFQRFSEPKRRAVRRATKNGITVKETNNIEEFIKLKTKDFWPMSYFMGKDVQALWNSFRPKNASVLLAYINPSRRSPSATSEVLRSDSSEVYGPVASILLLFHDKISYYWMATATNEGKKLFAPTLLVWEALKLAKKKGCKIFDFEGVYDERFHNATKKWMGFTKFKQGFGGKEISFPNPLIKSYIFGH